MSSIDEKLTLANENVPKVYAAGGGSIDLSNYVQKTDYAGQNKAGLVKIAVDLSRTAIEMDESNYITIIPANPGEIMTRLTNKPITPQNMNYAVKAALSDSQRISDMTVGEKANARDVISAVGFTDYATDTKAGVVKVESIKGIKVDESGGIGLNVPNETAIAQRLSANGNLPITIGNLDYAVRSVRPTKSMSLPNTLEVNTIYDLLKEQTVTLNLPSFTAYGDVIKYGDFIQVDFYSGKTPTNLTIACPGGSLSDIDLTPEANTMYSLYFDFGTMYISEKNDSGAIVIDIGWRFSYASYPHKEV